MKRRSKELPEELWESILNRLALGDDYGDLQSPSLVCKKFLSITSRLRRKLVANSDPFNSNKCEVLSRALERFGNLKEMELVGVFPEPDVNYPVLKIASSGLDLQSLRFHDLPISPSADTFRRLGSAMKNLKALRCRGFDSLRDPDLVHIADGLPGLEELDIRYPMNKLEQWKIRYPELSKHMVTDAGIEAISRKLPGLRRVYISGNEGCSDLSLIALSSNCVLLNEITCRSCNVTRRGIDWVLCHSTNLTSLKVGFYRSLRNSTFGASDDDLKIYATGLRELDIWGYDDQERIVWSIVKAGIPLEKLKLRGGQSLFDIRGVTTLLRACPTLKHFKFEAGFSFNDDAMRDLCRCLPHIVSIKLRGVSSLTETAFSSSQKNVLRFQKLY
ncbi:hypothetical protein C3L33_13624, partial [Rhododendron williamsianum]